MKKTRRSSYISLSSIKKKYLLNKNILFAEVLLISKDKENYGMFKIDKAREFAQEKQLDLFCINSNSKPPVCMIADFNKFCYEKYKVVNKNKNKKDKVKEIRIKPNIDINDLNIKANRTNAFLAKKINVKVSIKIFGRYKKDYKTHLEPLYKLIMLCKDYCQNDLSDIKIKQNNNFFEYILFPKK